MVSFNRLHYRIVFAILLTQTVGLVAMARSRLAPCPISPNCVSSRSERQSQLVEPFKYDSTAAFDHEDSLKTIVLRLPRTLLLEQDSGYLKFSIKSLVFRFVDILEFEFDPDSDLIHVRSASQTGYSDLGVNRKRVELIRKLWEEALR